MKLTKPQQKIYSRLLAGEKVTHVNTHRQSGGEFVWAKESYNGGIDYEKTVWMSEVVGYRAFWNLMRELNRVEGIEAGQFIYRFPNEKF